LIDGLVELIEDRHNGSLEAEHGSGRDMTPWIERESCAKGVRVMWRVKRLADPRRLLTSESVLRRDAGINLRDLKAPVAERGGGHRVRGVPPQPEAAAFSRRSAMAGKCGVLHTELPRPTLRDVATELERPTWTPVCREIACEIVLQRETGPTCRSFGLVVRS
jgi:hypothetical protein